MAKANGNAHREKATRFCCDRIDLEKRHAQWVKLAGFHLMPKPSSAIVRCGLAVNDAIRAGWVGKTALDDLIVEMFFRRANGLPRKLTRQFVPVYSAARDKGPISEALEVKTFISKILGLTFENFGNEATVQLWQVSHKSERSE
jgi:hypothetical protein